MCFLNFIRLKPEIKVLKCFKLFKKLNKKLKTYSTEMVLRRKIVLKFLNKYIPKYLVIRIVEEQNFVKLLLYFVQLKAPLKAYYKYSCHMFNTPY